MRFKVLVVWDDGEEEYLAEGNRDAVFSSWARAKKMADFMKIGMDGVQSISVVRAEAASSRTPQKEKS